MPNKEEKEDISEEIVEYLQNLKIGNFLKSRKPLYILGILFALVAGLKSVYMVKDSQRAIITTFGTVSKVTEAGMHLKIPFIQKASIIDVSTHGQSLGYEIADSTHYYGNSENPEMITSDFNLINVDFYMEYKVSDPVAFVYNSEDAELILTNEAMSSIRGIISDYPVDEVMTTAKGEIQQKIKESISAKLEERNIGLQLINIMIQDVEPPTREVFDAFKSVETAKQSADTSINNANRYRNEQLPEAEAEADRIIKEAEAEKESRIAQAEGEIARYDKLYEEYRKYPSAVKKRIFYETMEDLMPDLRVIIDEGNSQIILAPDLEQGVFYRE